jgi:quinol monooxygenase YgiN
MERPYRAEEWRSFVRLVREPMSRFGFYGKIIAHPGQRDALAAILLKAAAAMQHIPGCELYIVNVSPTEPDTLWVTEVWSSRADHAAALASDEARALIAQGRALIVGGERVELTPLGGKGLPDNS